MSKSTVWILALGLMAFTVPAFTSSAGAQQAVSTTGASARVSDVSAQQRARTRIVVRPLRRAPLDQRATRQCEDWYATEHRPSGTVIVPKMRCWWVRG